MKKETLINSGRFVGLLIIIAGVFCREWLPDDKEYIALILIIIGIAINIAARSGTKTVYVCPVCKAQFDMPQGELTLRTGGFRNRLKAALLTCPYCKKTNLCMGKRVAREKER